MNHTWTAQLATLDGGRKRALQFLYDNLPVSDLDCYPVSLFLEVADHALMLRETAPWCAALDEEIFHHYVLCPRINDEDLSFYHGCFHSLLWDRVQNLSVEERVLEVNRFCHEYASYQFQDDRTAAPLTVFRNGSGRCGEESAFLTAALRSVGIAARQVYAPRWSHCDDNHAWVEALCGDQWRFLGACEPEPILDRGWFNTAASRAMLIHSRTFGRGHAPLHGAFLGQEGAVAWYSQTPRYAKTIPYTFHAVRDGGRPAAGAEFRLQVLNEAGFLTIATLRADENGTAEAALGIGDLHVWAGLDGLCAEGDCENGHITLALAPPVVERSDWVFFDALAPNDTPINPALLTAEQKLLRTRVLEGGNGIRGARIAGYYDGARAATSSESADLLEDARGNFDGVYTFLTGDKNPLRGALLRTLTTKDLRDVSPEVLTDHLMHAPAQDEALPQEIYLNYLLSPRVALEKLTSWRGALAHGLTEGQRTRYLSDPARLWHELRAILAPPGDRTYANLRWPPVEALAAGRCDEASLALLYVATLRALGVPARLRPLDDAPQFWRDGAFHNAVSEKTGTLILTKAADQTPLYRQNWTLSRREGNGSWQLLRLEYACWAGDRLTTILPAGQYRLITSVRLPNGNQFAARRAFALAPGGQETVALTLRTFVLEDLLGCQDMPVISAETLEGNHIPDAARLDGRPSLLFWMEEGGEPTEHVLNELMDARLEALPINIVLLLRGRESLKQATLAGLLASQPEITVLFDDWAFDLDAVARHLSCDPDRPPLAVAVNGQGQAVYGVSGYHVGSVELLGRIAARLVASLGKM